MRVYRVVKKISHSYAKNQKFDFFKAMRNLYIRDQRMTLSKNMLLVELANREKPIL